MTIGFDPHDVPVRRLGRFRRL